MMSASRNERQMQQHLFSGSDVLSKSLINDLKRLYVLTKV